MTKALESDNSTLVDALIGIDYCLTLFKEGKDRFKDDPVLSSMFNSGWEKMEKYYKLSDRTPVYAAAIVLYPRRKWQWINTH
jgi:hypothetical protein